jgi:hypothetical protein
MQLHKKQSKKKQILVISGLINYKLVEKNLRHIGRVLLYPKAIHMPTQTQHATVTKTLSFYKELGIWYADLPAFLEAGMGTKANLMMVDGSDTFLDYLSNNRHARTSRTRFWKKGSERECDDRGFDAQ